MATAKQRSAILMNKVFAFYLSTLLAGALFAGVEWSPKVVWGSNVVRGSTILSGTDVVWGPNVWGTSGTQGCNVIWGSHVMLGTGQPASESTGIAIKGEN